MNDSANARERAAADGAPSAERVLVVEDDPATRIGLTELVRAWGYAADSARDGEEALEKVTSFRPGLVVTDLVMPRLDGHGLLKALRERDPEVSVIMLTAQGSVESAVDAMKGGAYDYLTQARRSAAASNPAREGRRAPGDDARGQGAAAAAEGPRRASGG